MYAECYHMSFYYAYLLGLYSYPLVEPHIQIYIRMCKKCNCFIKHKTKTQYLISSVIGIVYCQLGCDSL